MKAFIASLHHAVWTRKMVDIAGSHFTHNELEEPLRMLETAPDLIEALQELLKNPAGDYDASDGYDKACSKARAAIARATGEKP